eukprot:3863386-Karenia_brevis.AAC.1
MAQAMCSVCSVAKAMCSTSQTQDDHTGSFESSSSSSSTDGDEESDDVASSLSDLQSDSDLSDVFHVRVGSSSSPTPGDQILALVAALSAHM